MASAARFFKSAAEFRRWLERHHDSSRELLVGFYRVASGKGGLRHREALDEALAFGWIDGLVRGRDRESYTIRFSPRKKDSYWSAVNTKRFLELKKMGKVAAAGLRAFEARDAGRTKKYSFERDQAAFDAATEARLRADGRAAAFFEAQPPGYRKLMAHWIMSAKKEETRLNRMALLIARSAAGKRVDLLKPRAE